jgi:hypothetical protein
MLSMLSRGSEVENGGIGTVTFMIGIMVVTLTPVTLTVTLLQFDLSHELGALGGLS